jgi:hypothetical protein
LGKQPEILQQASSNKQKSCPTVVAPPTKQRAGPMVAAVLPTSSN